MLEEDEQAKGLAGVVELIADRQQRKAIPYVLPSEIASVSDKLIVEEVSMHIRAIETVELQSYLDDEWE
eukprot:557391-Karenia_brevis.AAC.1